jgi:hypothetical protein
VPTFDADSDGARTRIGRGGWTHGARFGVPAQGTPRCMRWRATGSQRSASGLFAGTSSDRRGRRPAGIPGGRPIQACGPRLFLVVMSRRTPFSVGPTYPDITWGRGGRSVQLPHCSGPGALTVAEPGSTDTGRCSRYAPFLLIRRRSLWRNDGLLLSRRYERGTVLGAVVVVAGACAGTGCKALPMGERRAGVVTGAESSGLWSPGRSTSPPIVATGWGSATGISCRLEASSPPHPIPTTLSRTAADMAKRFRTWLTDFICPTSWVIRRIGCATRVWSGARTGHCPYCDRSLSVKASH